MSATLIRVRAVLLYRGERHLIRSVWIGTNLAAAFVVTACGLLLA